MITPSADGEPVTDGGVDGDALRSDVERRVIDLLGGAALRSGREGLPR